MKKVSVIVPVYNAESVLHYCVDSILNQTFKDYELILVDDGSTDGSGALCDEYALTNENVLVKHMENQGVSVARNTGIELAKGEYICFVDSDDYVEKDFLQEMVGKAEEGFDFVLTAYQWVDDYNHNAFKIVIYKEKESYSVVDKNSLMDLSSLVLLSQPWNKLFKRKIIIENNIRMPEDISLGEDTVFVYRYLSSIINHKFLVINKLLYNYFSNSSDSLLNKYRSDLFEISVKLNDYLSQEVYKWDVSDEQLRMFHNACYYRMENVLFNTFRKENKQSDKEKLRYNNTVMKSKSFRYWLKKFSGKLNPIFRLGYSLKKFYPIYLLTKKKGGY